MRMPLKFLILALVASLTVMACGDDDDDDDNGDDVEATIYAELAADGDYDTLVTAIDAAGLEDTLDDEDAEYTVFAPNDAAFDALEDGVLDDLLEDTETLSTVLLSHVLEGTITAEEVESGTVTTAAGTEVEVEVDGDTVMFGGQTVVRADWMASNGVIHGIDGVYVPDIDDNGELATIVEQLGADPDYSIFVQAVGAADIIEELDGVDEYTLFAPDDDAFNAFLEESDDFDSVEDLLALDDLADILRFHVVSGTQMAADLETGPIETFAGVDADVDMDATPPTYQGVDIVDTDREASDGVIHTLGSVALPPEDDNGDDNGDDEDNIVEALQGDPDYSLLVLAVQEADLVDALSTTEDITVFAPNNDAFNAVIEDIDDIENADDLLALDDLEDILQFHVLPQIVMSGDIEAGAVETLLGVDAMIDVDNGDVTYEGVGVIDTDWEASNGVIHTLDYVAFPPE